MSRSSPQRVLVIDDDEDMRSLLAQWLQRMGFEAILAPDGRHGLRALFERRPDLVLLDVTMPGLDGLEVLDRIRDVSEVPVIMLTARAAEIDTVRGLRGGADDWVTKPFRRAELAARIAAVMRRAGPERAATAEVYEDALVRIDFARSMVEVEEREVSLTPLEFRLLAAFVRHPGQVLSRDQLLELVWGDVYGSGAQVKLYVGYLRRKLATTDGLPHPIETVRGFGYRYRPRSDAAVAS